MTTTQRRGVLLAAVNKSVKAAGDRLGDQDQATIEVARAYARQIDAVISDPDQSDGEKVKTLHLAPHLVAALKTLGLNEAGREEINLIRARVEATRSKADQAKSDTPLTGSAALKAQLRGLKTAS